MKAFRIETYKGALPIEFGISRELVRELLGAPCIASNNSDDWGERLEITVGYDTLDRVCHIGFSPGPYRLSFIDEILWSEAEVNNPVNVFLRYDPRPVEYLGFLVFMSLGIKVTGFHDGEDSDRAVVLFPKGAWDKYLSRAKVANLTQYSAIGHQNQDENSGTKTSGTDPSNRP